MTHHGTVIAVHHFLTGFHLTDLAVADEAARIRRRAALHEHGDSLAPRRMALASLAGLAVLYAVGMPYMALILNVYMGKGMTFSAILWAGMLPYLPGDAVKIVIAAGVCPILRRRLKLADTSHKRGE